MTEQRAIDRADEIAAFIHFNVHKKGLHTCESIAPAIREVEAQARREGAREAAAVVRQLCGCGDITIDCVCSQCECVMVLAGLAEKE